MKSIIQHSEFFLKNKFQWIIFYTFFSSILSICVVLNNWISRGGLGFFDKLNVVLSVYIFISSLLYIIFRFKKSKNSADLTIDSQGLILFDGIFNHRFHWNDIEKIEWSNENSMLLKWEDNLLNNKKYSNNFLKSYYFKKLLPSSHIDLMAYKRGDLIVNSLKQYYNITERSSN